MAWTSPKTWSGSEVLSSSDMNEQCSGNVEYLYNNFTLSNQWMNNGTSVSQENQRIESGKGTIAVTTSDWGTGSVTFNTAFGTAPRVLVGCELLHWAGWATNIGTGSFKAGVSRTVGTLTGSIGYDWIAIGA